MAVGGRSGHGITSDGKSNTSLEAPLGQFGTVMCASLRSLGSSRRPEMTIAIAFNGRVDGLRIHTRQRDENEDLLPCLKDVDRRLPSGRGQIRRRRPPEELAMDPLGR
jgi:hypothetical protein